MPIRDQVSSTGLPPFPANRTPKLCPAPAPNGAYPRATPTPLANITPYARRRLASNVQQIAHSRAQQQCLNVHPPLITLGSLVRGTSRPFELPRRTSPPDHSPHDLTRPPHQPSANRARPAHPLDVQHNDLHIHQTQNSVHPPASGTSRGEVEMHGSQHAAGCRSYPHHADLLDHQQPSITRQDARKLGTYKRQLIILIRPSEIIQSRHHRAPPPPPPLPLPLLSRDLLPLIIDRFAYSSNPVLIGISRNWTTYRVEYYDRTGSVARAAPPRPSIQTQLTDSNQPPASEHPRVAEVDAAAYLGHCNR